VARSEHLAAVARSAEALLDEIGDDRELTLVHGPSSISETLTRAGTFRLLQGRAYEVVGVDTLPLSSGDTALLLGSGGFCRPYHDWMPRALAIAELRFERVIVLPSSFDTSEDVVRSVLQRTRASVFAREAESLRQIQGLCRARAAHDCAFFFDYSGHPHRGEGTLNAFRTDREATEGELLVDDNDDISATAASLEQWLEAIESHAVVRTDRAHVMIAAALMGKEVEAAPCNYHKVQALATTWLRDFPVRMIPAPRAPPATRQFVPARAVSGIHALQAAAVPPPRIHTGDTEARVTAVIVTRDRPELAAGAARSVTSSTIPVRVVIIDNNSALSSRRELAALTADDPRIQIRMSDSNLGCAGGRRLGVQLVSTEFVLFLDDDAELINGALEHLLVDLDAHPAAAAVTALVVGPAGSVQAYGGAMEVSEGAVAFRFDGELRAFDDPSLAATGPTGWAPGGAALLRTATLRQVPLDDRMAAHYEDNDWCYRVELLRPGSFRRCREALVIHHHDRLVPRTRSSSRLSECSWAAERLSAHANFYRANGRILDLDLFSFLPELQMPDGSIDLPAARLLLELIATRGTDWMVMEWINGGLAPLLTDRHQLARLRDESSAREAQVAELNLRTVALEADRSALAAEVAVLSSGTVALKEERVLLQQRAETLARIEAGGWWQLRSRLWLPLRVASWIRRGVGATAALGRAASGQLARRGDSSRKRAFGDDLRLLHDTLATTSFGERYWMWGGVLLGWARDRDLLDHDLYDADFAFSVSDMAHFAIAARALIAAGFQPLFRFRNNEGTPTEYTFARNGAKFEFFAVEPCGETLRYHVFSDDELSMQATSEIRDQPLARFRFLRREWRKHADHGAELTQIYGDWQTPDPDWRYMEGPAIVKREPWSATDYAWTGEFP
jgi:GT2 family glycosyltransferase